MKTQKQIILFLFIITLFFRIIFFIILPKGLNFGDASQYENIALNFCNGNGMMCDDIKPITTEPNEKFIHNRHPGYIIFLAGIYKIFGHNNNIVFIIQNIIEIFTVILIYLVCIKIGVSKLIALIPAFLYAVYPITSIFSLMLLATTLFTFLLTLTLYLFVKNKTFSYKDYLLAGIISGITVLTRPVLQFIFLIVLLELILSYIKNKISLKKTILCFLYFFIPFILILSIWIYRNYRLFNKPFLGYGAGWTLYESNNPIADGGPQKEVLPLQNLKTELPYLEQDTFFKKKAVEWIINNPIKYLKLIPKRFIRFWNMVPNYEKFSTAVLKSLSIIFHLIIYGLMLYAVLYNLENIIFSKLIYLILLILYFTSIHSLLILGSLRYRTPIMPIIFILSGFGFYSLKNKLKNC